MSKSIDVYYIKQHGCPVFELEEGQMITTDKTSNEKPLSTKLFAEDEWMIESIISSQVHGKEFVSRIALNAHETREWKEGDVLGIIVKNRSGSYRVIGENDMASFVNVVVKTYVSKEELLFNENDYIVDENEQIREAQKIDLE